MDPDPGKTCLGGGMHCLSASSSLLYSFYSPFTTCITAVVFLCCSVYSVTFLQFFGAVGWVAERASGSLKNWVVSYWHGYLCRVRCKLAYGSAGATATHCLVFCFSKIQISFTFLVPAHLGSLSKMCFCRQWYISVCVVVWCWLRCRWSMWSNVTCPHCSDFCTATCRAKVFFSLTALRKGKMWVNSGCCQNSYSVLLLAMCCFWSSLLWWPSVLWRWWLSIWSVKNSVMRFWRGYLSWARCKWFAYRPADDIAIPSSLASLTSRMV